MATIFTYVGPAMNGRLVRDMVYTIGYNCAPRGLPDEYGTIVGYWNGEVDTWGKLTIRAVQSNHTHYLFADEIVDVREVEG